MKKRPAVVFILFPLAFAMHGVWAQTADAQVAAWLLPGVQWKASPKVSLFGELGYSSYFGAGLGYMQAFIAVHKHIVLNPGYLYLGYKDPAQRYRQEHFMMNAVIGQVSWAGFDIDDRNMLWNRIRVGDMPLHYYRNRLRVLRSFRLWEQEAKLYAYDELFFLFNSGQLMRNRVAVGTSYDLFDHLNMDVTYIRQSDRGGGRLHLFFIMGTWKF